VEGSACVDHQVLRWRVLAHRHQHRHQARRLGPQLSRPGARHCETMAPPRKSCSGRERPSVRQAKMVMCHFMALTVSRQSKFCSFKYYSKSVDDSSDVIKANISSGTEISSFAAASSSLISAAFEVPLVKSRLYPFFSANLSI
jgi:hypothetical protein